MTETRISPHELKHSRLVSEVRNNIFDGILKPEDRLPSEGQLSRRYGIGINSVRKGVDLLVKEGLIVRRQGSGTYVLARSVRLSRPSSIGTVAAIFPYQTKVYHPFFSEEVLGVQSGLRDLGYRVWNYTFDGVYNRDADSSFYVYETDKMVDAINSIDDLCGIIAGNPLADRLIGCIRNDVPIISNIYTEKCPYVDYDWTEELIRATQFSIRNGARSMLIRNKFNYQRLRERISPGLQILQRIPQNTRLFSEYVTNAYQDTIDALTEHPEIDTIIAGSDFDAQGMLDAVSRQGLRIPDDLQFVAMISRRSRLTTPFRFSSLVSDGYLKGRELVRLLHDHINRPHEAPEQCIMSGTLEMRN